MVNSIVTDNARNVNGFETAFFAKQKFFCKTRRRAPAPAPLRPPRRVRPAAPAPPRHLPSPPRCARTAAPFSPRLPCARGGVCEQSEQTEGLSCPHVTDRHNPPASPLRPPAGERSSSAASSRTARARGFRRALLSVRDPLAFCHLRGDPSASLRSAFGMT